MRSDAFPGDPYGWATNQAGHVCIGLAIATLTPWQWGGDAITIAAVYWIVSEVILQRRRLYLDAAADTGFVAAGAAYPLMPGYWWQAGLVALIGAALAIGAWVRR